ncbi:MAG: DUF6431 domain-containing protein [Dehalococcoidales bacterium]|nr:DUF6431 domain-containing protein [Dehalococcoidales bacterium]
MIILADFGTDVHHYRRQFAQLVFPRPRTCPQCAACDRLVGHGSYPRHVCDQHQSFVIRVKRLLCTACRHTISLLPSFCLPHRHYLAAVIQRVLDLRFQQKASWATIRRHFAPSELPALSTCRAWVRAFALVAERALATLLVQLATWQQLGKLELVIAELGTLPERPQQLVAAVPHLVAWLRDKGLSLPEAGSRWLATLTHWGQAIKLGRLV